MRGVGSQGGLGGCRSMVEEPRLEIYAGWHDGRLVTCRIQKILVRQK